MSVHWRGPKPVIVGDEPPNLPLRWWFMPPRGDARYRSLRGWPAFEVARRAGIEVIDFDDIQPGGVDPFGRRLTINAKTHVNRIWLGNPGTEGILDMCRKTRTWAKPPRLVVDVTFDITQIEQMVGGLDPADPLYHLDVETTQSAWHNHLPHLIEAVKLADVVTTVHPEWASPLTLLNEHVEVLPDLADEAMIPQWLATIADLFGDGDLVR